MNPSERKREAHRHYLWPSFEKFATDGTISLDHIDDWWDWWQCFLAGAGAEWKHHNPECEDYD